jgi:very-short-patch-repair endonuclease
MKRKWTEEEDNVLRAGWQIIATVELARDLNRPVKGVTKRANRLGLSDGRVKWDEDQIQTMRSNWGSLSAAEIAELLQRDVRTIYAKAFELKLAGGREHARLASYTGEFVDCANCGKRFYRNKSRVKDQNFCCHACRGAVLKPSEETIKKILLANKLKPNKLEVFLNSLLEKHFPGEFIFNGDLSQGVLLGGLVPDFINVNGKKQVIELFGDYWHDEKQNIPWKSTEFGRKAVFSQLGFECLVIWEHELESPDEVIKKIRGFNE